MAVRVSVNESPNPIVPLETCGEIVTSIFDVDHAAMARRCRLRRLVEEKRTHRSNR
jgi:hypothetical protein